MLLKIEKVIDILIPEVAKLAPRPKRRAPDDSASARTLNPKRLQMDGSSKPCSPDVMVSQIIDVTIKLNISY